MKKVIIVFLVTIVIGILLYSGIAVINNKSNQYYNNKVNDAVNDENKLINSCKISKITETKEIKSDSGEIMINVVYSYPIIENKITNEFIDEINSEYKMYADNFIQRIDERKADTQSLYESMGEDFQPHAIELDYEVNMNDNGLLSITNIEYYNTGGAHPSIIRASKNFDLNTKEELSLNKIINENLWDFDEKIYILFKEELERMEFVLNEMWEDVLKEELGNVQYYLNEGKIVLYFNAEQIAPYALGVPTVELTYDDSIFLIEI